MRTLPSRLRLTAIALLVAAAVTTLSGAFAGPAGAQGGQQQDDEVTTARSPHQIGAESA